MVVFTLVGVSETIVETLVVSVSVVNGGSVCAVLVVPLFEVALMMGSISSCFRMAFFSAEVAPIDLEHLRLCAHKKADKDLDSSHVD